MPDTGESAILRLVPSWHIDERGQMSSHANRGELHAGAV